MRKDFKTPVFEVFEVVDILTTSESSETTPPKGENETTVVDPFAP